MAKLCRALLLLAGSAVAGGMAIAGLSYPYLCLVVFGAASLRRMNAWRGSGSSHGTARIASLFDLMRAGMLGREDGFIFGRASLVDPPTKRQALRCLLSPRVSSAIAVRMVFAAFGRRPDAGLIRVNDVVHAITIAPSGAGKSTSVLVPNLRSYRGSCVVFDPKGELHRLSSGIRRHIFGHRIIRIDPFGLAGDAATSDALNPCDFISERDKGFYDNCRALADLLVMQRGTETDPHWNSRSIDVLTTFIVFVCALEADPAQRNLLVVRDLLASPDRFHEVLKVMQQTPGYEGVLSLLGDSLGWLKDREEGGVLSTVSRHISWLISPEVSAAIGRSSFDPRHLWSGKVTVYICLPHDKLNVLAPLMRMWLGTLLTLVSRNGGTDKYPVLFLIDEAATLGRMQPIEDAFSLLRGYGVKIWLFLQSLEQLKKCYGESASIILDNAGTQQYFGITSFDTSDQLSKRIGDATILVESINRSTSTSRPNRSGSSEGAGNTTTSEGVTISEQGRRLIRPEELLVTPRGLSLLFHRNFPVIPARLVEYFNAAEFAKGGTGRSRGLGVSSLAASAVVLAASLSFAGLMLALPSPDTLRQTSFVPRRRRQMPAVSSRSYSVPHLTYVPPPPARPPAVKAEPAWDWDLTGRVWRQLPDGSRQLMSGPLKPGRSGR